MKICSIKFRIYGFLHGAKIFVYGKNNTVNIKAKSVRNTRIIITGNNNHICIDENTVARQANIQFYGNLNSVFIGKNNNINLNAMFVCAGNNNHIRIGKDCLFSDQIDIWASDSHAIFDSEGKWMNPEKDVTIGDHVWIGRHARILKGVTIGEGAVIGMGATITHDVPARCVVVGGGSGPQKIVRENVSWSKDYPTEER